MSKWPQSQETYQSEIERVDFENDASRIKKPVNHWVSGKTKGKIPLSKLLSEKDTVDPDSIMVLLNAIYFKGSSDSRIASLRWENFMFHAHVPLNISQVEFVYEQSLL